MIAPTAYPVSRYPSSPVEWLWEPFLARGKLSILDGDPGVGKSLLAVDLAARLSRGGPLPDGALVGRPHVTLFLNAEDSVNDTIRPRAEAAGADLDRLLIGFGAHDQPLRLPDECMELVRMICEHRADLVVIDPVMAFLTPEVAADADGCVRVTRNPLAALAARTNCAVLLVRHLRKSGGSKALYRGLGGVGIIGVCRTGLLAARHPADPERRVLAMTKTNLGGPAPSLGFRLRADGAGRTVVEWTGPSDVSADALFERLPGPLRPRDRASDWLRRELSGGPRKAAELLATAAEAGIPEKTLRRAKADLKAGTHLVHGEAERAWYWYDPDAAWPADAPFEKPFGLDPLPELSEL